MTKLEKMKERFESHGIETEWTKGKQDNWLNIFDIGDKGLGIEIWFNKEDSITDIHFFERR